MVAWAWRARREPFRPRSDLGALALGAAAPWPGWRFRQSAADAAGRLFEYERGSGKVRLEPHRAGLAALGPSPARWLWGAGPGAWQDAASEQAHAVEGGHAAMTLGPSSPNSDALRTLVERGLVGLVGLTLACALAMCGARSVLVAEGLVGLRRVFDA